MVQKLKTEPEKCLKIVWEPEQECTNLVWKELSLFGGVISNLGPPSEVVAFKA
jgi:hypothetical protein